MDDQKGRCWSPTTRPAHTLSRRAAAAGDSQCIWLDAIHANGDQALPKRDISMFLPFIDPEDPIEP
jgi:hypothetical protein